MKKILLPILFCACYHVTLAQTTFNNRYYFDYNAAIITNIIPTDSCFYAMGVFADTIYPYNVGNIFIKFDLDGNELWHKVLANPTKSYEVWWDGFIATDDGGFAAAGYTLETGQQLHGWVAKYDREGDTVFTKHLLGIHHFDASDFIRLDVIKQFDGDYYVLSGEVAGNEQDANAVLVKLDSAGNVLRRVSYDSWMHDFVRSLTITRDSSLLIGICQDDQQVYDPDLTISQTRIIKVDTSGQILWQYYSDPLKFEAGARDIVETPDGGYIYVSGDGRFTMTNGHPNSNLEFQGLAVKLDAQQQVEWRLKMGNWAQINRLIKVMPLENGNYAAAGTIIAEVKDTALWPVRGEYDRSGWLVSFSPQGDSLWGRTYVGMESISEWHDFLDASVLPDGGFLLCGESMDADPFYAPPIQRGWMVRTDAYGCVVPGCQVYDQVSVLEAEEEVPVMVYPNPATDMLYVYLPNVTAQMGDLHFTITNMMGQTMRQWEAPPQPSPTYIIPVQDYPAGMYVVTLWQGGKVLRSEQVVVGRP